MKYKCSICGYEYDEAKEGIAFADLPDDWQCPLCGAPKAAFEPIEEQAAADKAPAPAASVHEMDLPAEAPVAGRGIHSSYPPPDESMQKLSMGQMAALCSNLARGCEKQYMFPESELFQKLAEWFTQHTPPVNDSTVEDIASQLQQDLKDFPAVGQTAVEQGDRGAQRVLGWSEKVTRMLNSLMSRYQREGDNLLADSEIWVCSVCGFTYIGKEAPELCPVCKVPSWKFIKIERRKKP